MIELYNNDCLIQMDELIAKGIKVDAIITDPPYGTTACQWDNIIPFDAMWERLNKLIKPNGAIVLFGSEPFSSALRMSNIKNYKYDWVWDKVTARGHLVAKHRPMQQTEDILVFSKKGKRVNYYPIMVKRPEDKILVCKTRECRRTEIMGGKKGQLSEKIYDKWYPKNILTFSNANSSTKSIHPTQKPVALMEYLIKTYTNENETVLDFTMGSGTTGVACKNLNRSFIGIELDKKYCDIANDRINGTLI